MATMETGVASGVSFALTDEQRELRALAREFAAKEIRPKAAEYDEHQTHPADIVAKAHEVGLMNLHLPESARRPRALGVRRDARRRGAELGVLGDRDVDPRQRPRRGADPDRRHRGAEARVARAARRGADPRLLRALGAGRRLGRVGDPDHGRQEGRRVRRQRLEDVHHERRPGVVDRVLRLDGPVEGAQGALRLRDPDGRRRRHDREAPRQDGAARDRHVGGRVPGRRRARGEPPRRRGRRVQDRDADARLHAPGHRDRRRRRRPGGVRARGRLREGARPVRHADRDEPGRLVPRRRHGDRDRGVAPPHAGRRPG